jgi:hypothetical protein
MRWCLVQQAELNLVVLGAVLGGKLDACRGDSEEVALDVDILGLLNKCPSGLCECE